MSVDPDIRGLAGYQHLSEVYATALEEAGNQEMLEESIEEIEDELGISLEEDIQPWLGTELGLAVADFQSLAEGDNPALAVVAETKDHAASDAFLQKVREHLEDQDYSIEEETYKDVVYYVQEIEYDWDTPLVFGVVGDFVILASDTDIMEDVIDVSKGEADPLSKNENYTQLIEKLPGDAAAIAFYDMQALMDVALEDSGVEVSGEAIEVLEAYEAFGMAVTLNTEGVQIDFAVTFDPEALPESTLRGFESMATPERLLQQIPSKALGFVVSQIPDNYWENVLTTMEDNPDFENQLQDFEDATGLKFDDLFGWMTGEVAIAVVEVETGDEFGVPVGGFGILEAGDMEAAQEAMEDLTTMLEEEMYMEFEEEEIGGVEMQVIIEPYSEEIMGGYGFTDRDVIIGFTEDALEMAVDDSGDPIANDETFEKVRAYLPSNNNGYIYANVEGIWQLVRDNMSEYEQEDFDENSRPFLEPIKAIGMAAGQTDPQQGYVLATLFIYIP
jgi:hypothetical protein